MGGIDWDEWIRSDADNINQLRGMGRADSTTLEVPMARPKNSDIREWWHTPIRDLTASQRKQALALYIREERVADPQPLMRLLSDNPNLSIAKGGEMLATMARPDTVDKHALLLLRVLRGAFADVEERRLHVRRLECSHS